MSRISLVNRTIGIASDTPNRGFDVSSHYETAAVMAEPNVAVGVSNSILRCASHLRNTIQTLRRLPR